MAVRIQGEGAIQASIKRLQKKYRPVKFVVGFSQNYAIFVHEDLRAYHPVGQAKFLEQPARTMGRELGRGVANDVSGGLPLEAALLRAGLKLQAEAQKLTPVDTGALRASAFTRLEGRG